MITATIPITWASSIIVNESTDAIDYYDGFDTQEMVIGVRAYQWGWEYYYPKDLDLFSNLKNKKNIFYGNKLSVEKKNFDSRSQVFYNLFLNSETSVFNLNPLLCFFLKLDNFKFLTFSDVLTSTGLITKNEDQAFQKSKFFSSFSSSFFYSSRTFLNKNFFFYNKNSSFINILNSNDLSSFSINDFLTYHSFKTKNLPIFDFK